MNANNVTMPRFKKKITFRFFGSSIRDFKSWPKTAVSLNQISDQKNIDQTPFYLSNLTTSKMEALKAASHKSLPPTNGQQFMIHSIDNV